MDKRLAQTLIKTLNEAKRSPNKISTPGQSGKDKNITRASFVGPNSTVWDQKSADRASELEKSGSNRDDIWRQTGTVRLPDGNWAQEVDDSNMNWRDGIFNSSGQLNKKHTDDAENTINAPNLFAAYPQLRNYTMTLDRQSNLYPGVRGYFDRTNREIAAFTQPEKDEPSRTPNEILNSTAHELGGHAVQDQEGWAPGGMPGSPGEHVRRVVGTPLDTRSQELRNRDDAIQKIMASGNPNTAVNSAAITLDYPIYSSQAGEIAAREVQDRQNMNADERRATTPRFNYSGRDRKDPSRPRANPIITISSRGDGERPIPELPDNVHPNTPYVQTGGSFPMITYVNPDSDYWNDPRNAKRLDPRGPHQLPGSYTTQYRHDNRNLPRSGWKGDGRSAVNESFCLEDRSKENAVRKVLDIYSRKER